MNAIFTDATSKQINWTDENAQLWSVAYPLTDGEIPRQIQKWLDAGNVITPAPTPETSELKYFAARAVVSYIDSVADLITGPVPMSEKESWTKKEIAAREYLADPVEISSDKLSLLQNELDLTVALDTDLHTLASKIIVQADLYSAFAGKMAGIRRTTMIALDALPSDTTQNQIDAVLASAYQQVESVYVSIFGKPTGLV